jgi:hypothetical protein
MIAHRIMYFQLGLLKLNEIMIRMICVANSLFSIVQLTMGILKT